MQTAWESQIAGFLRDLSAVQEKILDVLMRKRALIVASDMAGLAAVNREEEELMSRLQGCLECRATLLRKAQEEGICCNSIEELAETLPRQRRGDLPRQVHQASQRSQLLQHHSLANWVLIQRTLLHLSQLLEIIATGGRLRPTYGKEVASQPSGSLVDQEV